VQTCMRQGDILSRVAGDEFAVLLDDVSGEQEAVRLPLASNRRWRSLSISLARKSISP
jgi:GGDEF domain-containing protein